MVPILVMAVVGLAGVVLTGVVIAYWPRIMDWARNSLLTWADEYLPEYSADIRKAFLDVDGKVVEVRKAIRDSWRRVRQVLLKETAEFVHVFNDEYAMRITSYLKNRENAEKPVIQMVTTQAISYDELPDDVRAELIRTNTLGDSMNIVTARDRLLENA
jgi:hypothetical protein